MGRPRGASITNVKDISTNEKSIQMTEVPAFQAYKNISNVLLNEGQVKKITDQLAIQEESKIQLRRRALKDDYFLTYDYNPLLPSQ